MHAPAGQQIITICPSRETLMQWLERMVPARDVWYWDDSLTDINVADGELLGRCEYLDHDTYSHIEYVNAYWHWRMPKGVQQVLVCDSEWIGSLSTENRFRVLAKQVELDRGLIFPRSHFDVIPHRLQPYVIGDKIVIGRAGWMSLDQTDQVIALTRETLLWDDPECFPIPDDMPAHIRAIANTYGDIHGTNCLSTTAFCMNGDESIRQQWMFQPAFIKVLDDQDYQPTDESTPSAGDVIVFRSNGTIVHAVFCIGPDLFVNKNGQSMFNPVRIVNRAMLDADWNKTNPVIFRSS